MVVDFATGLSLLAITLTVLGLMTQHFLVIGRIQSDVKVLKSSYPADLMERVAKLETMTAPFWRLLENQLVEILKAPHTPRLDKLLEVLQNGPISAEEIVELKALLESEQAIEMSNPHPDKGRLTALALLRALLETRIRQNTEVGNGKYLHHQVHP